MLWVVVGLSTAAPVPGCAVLMYVCIAGGAVQCCVLSTAVPVPGCAVLMHVQPEEQPNVVFRHLWEIQHLSGECLLCQFLVRHRINPQESYDTCLFDKDW